MRREEFEALRRRLVIAVVLSLPIFVIGMSHGRIAALGFPGIHWLEVLLATPVVFYGWCTELQPVRSHAGRQAGIKIADRRAIAFASGKASNLHGSGRYRNPELP